MSVRCPDCKEGMSYIGEGKNENGSIVSFYVCTHCGEQVRELGRD